MSSSTTQPILSTLPLIPSGVFQAPIIFPNVDSRASMKVSQYTGRLEPVSRSKSSRQPKSPTTHFHVSSQNILFTFSYPDLKRLNAVDFSHLNSAIIHLASHDGRLFVVFSNGTVEMRDLDDISHRLGHWEAKLPRALKWTHADSIVVDGTLRVYGVEEISEDWFASRLVIDYKSSAGRKALHSTGTTLINDAVYPYFRGANDTRHKVHGVTINNAENVLAVLTTTTFYFIQLKQNSQGEMTAKGGSKLHHKAASTLRYMYEADAYLVGTETGEFHLYLQKQTIKLHKHISKITWANFVQNGKYLAVCSKEGKISVHNVKNVKAPPRVYHLKEHICHFAVAPTQDAFITVTRSNKLRVVDMKAESNTVQYLGEYDGFHALVSNTRSTTQLMSPNTRSDVVLVTGLPCIQFYNISTGQPEQSINLHNQVPEVNIFGQTHSNFKVRSLRLNCVAFSADDSLMATAEYMAEEVSIKLWQHTVAQGYVLKTVLDSPHTNFVVQLLFSPDSSKLISLGSDSVAKVWDLTDDEVPCVRSLTYNNRTVQRACFSRDGSVLALLFKKRLTFWDVDEYELQRDCHVDVSHVRSIDFVSDVALLINSQDAVRYFSLRTMQFAWKYGFSHQDVHVAVNPHRENEFALTSMHLKHSKKGRVYLVSCGDDIERPHFITYPTNAGLLSVRFLDDSRFVTLSSSMELRVYSTSQERGFEASHLGDVQEFSTKIGLRREESMTVNGDEDGGESYETRTQSFSSSSTKMNLKRHKQDPVRGRGPWGELFSAPSHALPSSSDVFDSFMDAFLIKKDAQVDHVDMLHSDVLGWGDLDVAGGDSEFRFSNAKTLEFHKGSIKLKLPDRKSQTKSDKQALSTSAQFEPLRMKVNGEEIVVNSALWERNGKVLNETERTHQEQSLHEQLKEKVFSKYSWKGKVSKSKGKK